MSLLKEESEELERVERCAMAKLLVQQTAQTTQSEAILCTESEAYGQT